MKYIDDFLLDPEFQQVELNTRSLCKNATILAKVMRLGPINDKYINFMNFKKFLKNLIFLLLNGQYEFSIY